MKTFMVSFKGTFKKIIAATEVDAKRQAFRIFKSKAFKLVECQ